MKKVVRVFGLLIIAVYLVIAVFLTVCLLNYNKYHITELGKNSLIIVSDDDLEPNFAKNDLVVVYKNNNEDIKGGDYVFFYNAYQNQVSVNHGKVIKATKINEKEYTYTLEGNLDVSSQYVIGKSETSKVYSNMGLVLKILESRLGFLLIIILPVLVLFIYQIYAVILEIKRPVNE